MNPLPAFILAAALSSSPASTRTTFVQSNFSTFKIERIRSAYERVIKAAFWASRKSQGADPAVLRLLSLSDLCKSRLARLDYKEVIAQSITDEWFKQVATTEALSAWANWDMSRESRGGQNAVYKGAADRNRNSRAEEMAFRIMEELADDGYPVFWTLTVDPENEHIINKGRNEFRNWLRSVRKRFGDFRYCCVTECGAEGRLHYHSLFIFSDLSECTDPNHLHPNGNRMEIPEMRGFWPYGLSNPVAVRYSPVDIYGRLRWRWPKGQQTGNPRAVALYMAKYLTKSTDEVNGCRSKMTRRFGLMQMDKMTDQEALQILLNNPDPFVNRCNFRSAPPLTTLRRIAARKLFASLPRLPLPEMKTGSVAQAAQMLATAKSIPMNVGDSIAPGPGFDGELDQYGESWTPVSMGKII